MPIQEKTRLGPYEILNLIGAGGMGEVYRARDTRLERMVAIKVISEALSTSDFARERFQREARAASALSHPHICTVYDVGEWQGRWYLAMEYLDGQNLGQRIETKRLKLDEILRFAVEITDGLQASHERGIVHRDIKPGNIFVTTQGHVKIVDFGLAKRTPIRTRANNIDLGNAGSTLMAADLLTSPGSVAGTIAYMSPEQARGEELDSRSDLFSFGLVLYEMSTGRLAFDGTTPAVVFTALLTAEPVPPSEVNRDLPIKFDEIVAKALEKDRELRYQNASEIRTDLKRLQRSVQSDPHSFATPSLSTRTANDGGEKALKEPVSKSHRWEGVRGWFLPGIGLLLAATIASFSLYHRRAASLTPKLHLVTTNSPSRPTSSPCISPDGKYVAYGERGEVIVREIASGEIRRLPRSKELSDQDDWGPAAWYPDGSHLLLNSRISRAGRAESAIWTISMFSGAATKIHEGALGSAVSPDGSLIAALAGGSELDQEIWVMGPQGEDAHRVAGLATNEEGSYQCLRWLPTGQRLGYLKTKPVAGEDTIDLETIDLKGNTPRVVVPNARDWREFWWLPDSRLLYIDGWTSPAKDRNFWELKIDGQTDKPVGQPRKLSDLAGFTMNHLSVAADGKKAVFQKWSNYAPLSIGHLRANGALETPRRLNVEDYFDYPWTWTADSRAVFFSRFGITISGTSIFKQGLESEVPELIVPLKNRWAQAINRSPDGSSLIFLSISSRNARTEGDVLERVPISGGVPQTVMKGMFQGLWCPIAPAKDCVLEAIDEQQQQRKFVAYNPAESKTRELFSIPLPITFWNISPDGSRIAILGPSLNAGSIQVRLLNGKVEKDIRLRGWSDLKCISWAADGKSLLVGATTPKGATLLRSDFDGKVQVLWTSEGSSRTWAIPSPDGQYLAIHDEIHGRNVWLMEDF